VTIEPRDLGLKTVMHRRSDEERIGFFFEPARWQGELVNAEPDKCDRLAWFSPDALPANTISYIREAIGNALAGVAYADRWRVDD
jgi:hypothetical protein